MHIVSSFHRIGLVVLLACAAQVLHADPTTPDQPTDAATRPSSVKAQGAGPNGQQARPTTRRSSRRVTVKIPPTVLVAIKQIRLEVEQGKPRKEPDYFTQTPNAEMTAEVVIALLQGRQGTSPSMDAYIKWQVLGALPTETPEQYVGDLGGIYRNAVGFAPRPGLLPDVKRQLDRELRKAQDGQDVVRQLNAAVANVDAANQPVVAYRDELLQHLPDSYDTLESALRDLYQRAEAGMDVGPAGDAILQRVTQWAQQTDSTPDLRAMAGLLDHLRRAEMPTYYQTCHFSRDAGGYVWDEGHPDINRGGRIDDALRVITQKTGPIGQKTVEHSREKRRN